MKSTRALLWIRWQSQNSHHFPFFGRALLIGGAVGLAARGTPLTVSIVFVPSGHASRAREGFKKSFWPSQTIWDPLRQQLNGLEPARNAIDIVVFLESQVYERSFCNTNKWVSSRKMVNRSPVLSLYAPLEEAFLDLISYQLYRLYGCLIHTLSVLYMA